jgi:hypothetical protein
MQQKSLPTQIPCQTLKLKKIQKGHQHLSTTLISCALQVRKKSNRVHAFIFRIFSCSIRTRALQQPAQESEYRVRRGWVKLKPLIISTNLFFLAVKQIHFLVSRQK